MVPFVRIMNASLFDVERAFVAVALDCRRRVNGLFDAWIPGLYWAHLVNQKLPRASKTIASGRILSALRKTNAIDRLLLSAFDKSKYNSIRRIHYTQRRINKKAYDFFYVQVAIEAPSLSSNDDDRQAFFVEQLQKYASRVPSSPPRGTSTTLHVNTNLPANNPPAAQVTPDTVSPSSSHYCYQPFGSMRDYEVSNACTCFDMMDSLWRKLSNNVPPKVHSWQHLKEDLRRLKGMKQHQESPIEVAHQIGGQSSLRFRALAGSTERKIQNELKWDANSKDPAVLATQEAVRAARARNFGPEARAKREKKQAMKKKAKQSHIEEVLSWPEITGKFPSLLELTIEDRRRGGGGYR